MRADWVVGCSDLAWLRSGMEKEGFEEDTDSENDEEDVLTSDQYKSGRKYGTKCAKNH